MVNAKLCLIFVTTLVFCNANEEDVKNSTNFSFDLYRNLFNPNENVVFSPYAFRIVLSVLYQTSSGTTESELRTKVNFHGKSEMLPIQKLSVAHILSSPNVKLANKVYIKNESTPSKVLLSSIQDLQSAVEQIDFSKSQEATDKMNNWVENQTHGLIKNLVPQSSVDSDTSLFILNTLYFKANWVEPFPTQLNRNMKFTGEDGVVYNTNFMSMFNEFKLTTRNSLEVLELPYQVDSNFVMWFILPENKLKLNDILPKLNRQTIKDIDEHLEMMGAIVNLPIFESEMDIDGVSLLKNLGIRSLFNSGELDMLENYPPMFVDEIRQKVKIIVNNDGTEAASGTYVKPFPITIWPEFNADRPFIYMILTADTKEMIFMGHFVKP